MADWLPVLKSLGAAAVKPALNALFSRNPSHKLCGYWAGEFDTIEDGQRVSEKKLTTELLIVQNAGTQFDALVYYKTSDGAPVSIKGLDKLIDGAPTVEELQQGRWQAEFQNKIHEIRTENGVDCVTNLHSRYDWMGDIHDWTKMKVTVIKKTDSRIVFQGWLSKR